MKRWINYFGPFVAAALLGCLLTVAYAPYDVYPLGILAPAGLLYLWRNIKPGQAFWRGLWFGVGNFATGIYWVYHSIHFIGGVPTAFAMLITTAFVFILSFFPAVCGYALTRYFPFETSIKSIFAFPAIWVWCDWMRSYLFTGFPWLFIGYTQINSPLSSYASIFSVYGVTIITLMCSALILNAYLFYRDKMTMQAMRCLFAVATLFIGGKMIEAIHWTTPTGKAESIALIQGNIPQSLKWSPEHTQLSYDRYQNLSEPLYGKVKLIIWPEAAIPVPMQSTLDFIEATNHHAQQTGTDVILGIPVKAPTGDTYYNSVISLGSTNQIYNKRHLVPFGEYIPHVPMLDQAMNFLNIPMSDSIGGRADQTPMTINGTQILVNVCYEIAYPELIRDDVVDNSNLGFVLTVTNDAWFGHTNAQAQHLQMAQMRAIELGRSVVFSSNDGITAIINANGVIAAEAPAYVPYVLTGDVQPMHGTTPWMREFGNSSFKYLMIVFLIFALHERFSKRRSIRNEAILESNI